MVKAEKILAEIRHLCSELPRGKAHMVMNRCDNIQVLLRKKITNNNITMEVSPNKNGYRAILSALMEGRKLSQLDCSEFGVEDMRTPVSHLRNKYNATHELRSRWITTSTKRRIKEYHLVRRENL